MLVQYNKANICDAYGMKLYPGVNDVDPASWKLAEEDKEIESLIDRGFLVVLSRDQSQGGPAPKKTESLDGYSEKKALEVIAKTFNYEMLQLWKASEKRAKLIVAIENQIAEMKKEKK